MYISGQVCVCTCVLGVSVCDCLTPYVCLYVHVSICVHVVCIYA